MAGRRRWRQAKSVGGRKRILNRHSNVLIEELLRDAASIQDKPSLNLP
jgi:hypothetical protein